MKINKRVRYKINKPLSGLMVFRLIMSLAERLSTKTSHFPPRLCFSAKFWTLSAYISAPLPPPPPSLKRNVKPGQLPRYNPGIFLYYLTQKKTNSMCRLQLNVKNLLAITHPPSERAISRVIKEINNL